MSSSKHYITIQNTKIQRRIYYKIAFKNAFQLINDETGTEMIYAYTSRVILYVYHYVYRICNVLKNEGQFCRGEHAYFHVFLGSRWLRSPGVVNNLEGCETSCARVMMVHRTRNAKIKMRFLLEYESIQTRYYDTIWSVMSYTK